MEPEFLAEPPLVVVISGPSGVGKDRVIEELRSRGYPFHYTVTATTREPRPEETSGVSYFFYERTEFERLISEGFFIEYSLVYDRYYGVPRDQIERALGSGLDVIVKPDVQGAVKLRRLLPEAVLIFVAPESIEQLGDRMGRRGSDSPDEVRRRLDAARAEVEHAGIFDYLVINREGRIEEAVSCVEAILQAEKSRVKRRLRTTANQLGRE